MEENNSSRGSSPSSVPGIPIVQPSPPPKVIGEEESMEQAEHFNTFRIDWDTTIPRVVKVVRTETSANGHGHGPHPPPVRNIPQDPRPPALHLGGSEDSSPRPLNKTNKFLEALGLERKRFDPSPGSIAGPSHPVVALCMPPPPPPPLIGNIGGGPNKKATAAATSASDNNNNEDNDPPILQAEAAQPSSSSSSNLEKPPRLTAEGSLESFKIPRKNKFPPPPNERGPSSSSSANGRSNNSNSTAPTSNGGGPCRAAAANGTPVSPILFKKPAERVAHQATEAAKQITDMLRIRANNVKKDLSSASHQDPKGRRGVTKVTIDKILTQLRANGPVPGPQPSTSRAAAAASIQKGVTKNDPSSSSSPPHPKSNLPASHPQPSTSKAASASSPRDTDSGPPAPPPPKRRRTDDNDDDSPPNDAPPPPPPPPTDAEAGEAPPPPNPLELLEAKFRETPYPLPSDRLELVDATGLKLPQINKWFWQRRKGANSEDRMEMEAVPPPARASPPPPPIQNNREPIPSTSANAFVPVPVTKLKYLRDPNLRTLDVSILKGDFEKLKTCPMEDFNLVLRNSWNSKALLFQQNLKLSNIMRTITKETRRLRSLFRSDPFSISQKLAIAEWAEVFLTNNGADVSKNRHTFEEIIRPWMAPYFYSKLTRQDGRALTLEVALRDFDIIFGNGTIYDWQTPVCVSC